MKNIFIAFFGVLLINTSFAQKLSSPDGNFTLTFWLNDIGTPVYTLSYKGNAIVNPSLLGLKLKEAPNLTDSFKIISTSTSTFDETWKPVWGEVSQIRNQYNEILIELEQPAYKRQMNIRFRLFNDGLGFRYEFDKQPNLAHFKLTDECTQFAMPGNHKIFWIPGDFDSNEYFYNTTTLSEIDAFKAAEGSSISTTGLFNKNAVQTPLLMKTAQGIYISIFEAALSDYSAMHLVVDKTSLTFTAALVPSAEGVKAYMQTPQTTPWRTIIASDKATDILASKIILNLNEPCKIENTDFIKPQKFIGIWWGMHVPGHWSWNYADESNLRIDNTNWKELRSNGRHGATTGNVKKYIDFASANKIEGVLVEGWNIGWEDWSGTGKENVFDFVTPYPDFDVKELSSYAKQKGVKLIMHHETAGVATNYERYIDTAYKFMKQYGYDAVKTGYVGKIIPRGEKHDGQWMVNHYQRVIEKTAEKNIMLDAHEPVRPTGQSRTYPNLMACEAARGNEFNAWSTGNPPEHETIMPFTRLKGGPMDYTPGIFEIKMDYYQKGNPFQVHTTLAKQLALYVTMYSPLQMAADLVENYEKRMDAFQFIKDVGVDWEDTKYLEAEPGDYLTVARKEKGTGKWFIGAITDENKRVATIKFDYLEKGIKYKATIYEDAPDAHWKDNPMVYRIRNIVVTSKTILKQKLAAGGGVAISLIKM